MTTRPQPNVREFADRALREGLQDPANLRDFLREVAPSIVDLIDFSRVEILDREFFLPTLLTRESDLLIKVRLKGVPGCPEMLLMVLIEHQSGVDRLIAMRVLIYMALYWDREMRDHQAAGETDFLFSAFLSIVFYTGDGRWIVARSLDDLLSGPEEIRAFGPRFAPLFWELPAHSAESLLASAGAWIQALAVVREDGASAERYQEVLAETARRLEALGTTDPQRWTRLLQFILKWSSHSRAASERDSIFETVEQIHSSSTKQDEVRAMTKTITEALVEEGLERGLEQGREQGLEQGREQGLERGREQGLERGRVESFREALTDQLIDKFGAVPAPLAARIAASTDAEALRRALRSVPKASQPQDVLL